MNTKQSREISIFMPGRLCLFGEHSDWAGAYRKEIEGIEPGYCLIVGTDQGIYAAVQPSENYFEIQSRLPNRQSNEPFRTSMTTGALLRAAESKIFPSYAAGTAHETLSRYPIGGISIDAYRMDLPLKKGLSSSAAICMLTVRALNMIYQLDLEKLDEMEIAYHGEITAGSACGRMDQACAYGSQPTFLTFDGDRFDVEPLIPRRELYISIVDLNGEKNTRKILSSLNTAFLDRSSLSGANVRRALGETNTRRLQMAKHALLTGDAESLGQMMSDSQRDFDELVAPACPDQLTSPKLHSLLSDPLVQELSLGGKGIGSQGDGCAQLIFSDPDLRKTVSKYLMNRHRLTSYDLTIPPMIE